MIIIIRADYDQMPEISKRLGREAVNVKRSIDSLNRTIEVLKGGDWFGEGANAFYREMESQVMPSMQRLQTTLEMGSGAVKTIERLLHEAEEAIGGLFSAMLGSLAVGITIEIGGLGAAVGGGGSGSATQAEAGGGGGAAASEPEKPASGGGGGGAGGGAGGGGGGGGGGSWNGEIGFKQEKPAPGGKATPPARPRRP